MASRRPWRPPSAVCCRGSCTCMTSTSPVAGDGDSPRHTRSPELCRWRPVASAEAHRAPFRRFAQRMRLFGPLCGHVVRRRGCERSSEQAAKGGRVSDIAGELARVRGAFEHPRSRCCTSGARPSSSRSSAAPSARDQPPVAGRAAARPGRRLPRRAAPRPATPDLPTGTGRDLCLRWMRGQWLVRSTEEDGTEMYSLTSHAQDALSLVTSLTRERASLSEHRIATIVSCRPPVQRRGQPGPRRPRRHPRHRDRSADRRTRPAARRRRPAREVSADYMLEGFSELLQLIAALPSDFARVEEAFVALRSAHPRVVPGRGPPRRRGHRRLPAPRRHADDRHAGRARVRGRVRAAA